MHRVPTYNISSVGKAGNYAAILTAVTRKLFVLAGTELSDCGGCPRCLQRPPCLQVHLYCNYLNVRQLRRLRF